MEDLEGLHTSLVEMDLPSSLADLKNPTKDYIITLITQFLGKFKIDVGTIRKPTFDQLSLSLAEDNHEILGLVNLSEAITCICSNIFLKDFHLTDITSPVQKKTKRIAKLMANFLLYATTKMLEIEARLAEFEKKQEQLQQLRNERMAILDAKNAQALRISDKIKANEQIKAKIAKLRVGKEERRSRFEKNEEKLKAAQQQKNEIEQRHRDLTAQAMKTRRELADVKSRVVRSPERHEALLHDLLEQKKQQSEKRENKQEELHRKVPAIEQTETCLTFVRQAQSKLPEMTDLYNRFAENKKKMEYTMKQLAELKNTIDQESNVVNDAGVKVNDTGLQKAKNQCEEQLFSVRQEHKKLSTEKKVLERKNEESKSRLQEISAKRDEIRATIAKNEAESKKYLKQCLELYNAEIEKEEEICIMLKPLLEKKD